MLISCVASSNMSRSITDLQVLQESGLPPDHPPISLPICCTGVNLNHVFRRAEDLLNCFVSDTHFESVLNPRSVPPDCDVSTDVTIPVLDCHISPAEVSDQVKNLSRIKPADQTAFQLAYFRSYQCTSL